MAPASKSNHYSLEGCATNLWVCLLAGADPRFFGVCDFPKQGSANFVFFEVCGFLWLRYLASMAATTGSYSASERGASARPRFYRGAARIDRDKEAVRLLPVILRPRLSSRAQRRILFI